MNEGNVDLFNDDIGLTALHYGHSVAVQLTQIVNSELGGRTAGSDAEHKAADWLAEEMKKIGLLKVKKKYFIAD